MTDEKPILYTEEKIEFVGNRNMIRWHIENTKIPLEVVYRATGFTKEQIEGWMVDQPVFMDDIRVLCDVLIISSASFFLNDENMNREYEEPTYNHLIVEGKHVLMDVDTIRHMKYNIQRGIDGKLDKELVLHQMLRYLKEFDDFI